MYPDLGPDLKGSLDEGVETCSGDMQVVKKWRAKVLYEGPRTQTSEKLDEGPEPTGQSGGRRCDTHVPLLH